MRNISIKVEGEKLVITMDISAKALKDAPLSSTGKTQLVATTAGQVPVPDRPGLSIAVNLMQKPGAR